MRARAWPSFQLKLRHRSFDFRQQKKEKITRNPSLDPSADGVVKDTDGERKGNSDGVEERGGKAGDGGEGG